MIWGRVQDVYRMCKHEEKRNEETVRYGNCWVREIKLLGERTKVTETCNVTLFVWTVIIRVLALTSVGTTLYKLMI